MRTCSGKPDPRLCEGHALKTSHAFADERRRGAVRALFLAGCDGKLSFNVPRAFKYACNSSRFMSTVSKLTFSRISRSCFMMLCLLIGRQFLWVNECPRYDDLAGR